MQDTPDFYFDSINQVRMDQWAAGRVVLLGDAGYAVSLSTGQGTSVAMVAAYVLAGELAAHKGDPLAGLRSYEEALRGYVVCNQALADQNSLPEAPSSEGATNGYTMIDPGSVRTITKGQFPSTSRATKS
jgi:2-polyprenyl-6-methoxyphenol hydroxylase-like FAD-dependent oxidoreductase